MCVPLVLLLTPTAAQIQMGGTADKKLSSQDLCMACHSTVHALLKKRRPGQMIAEVLEDLCTIDNMRVYPLFPPAMVKGCTAVSDVWGDSDVAVAALKQASKGEREWEEARDAVCTRHSDFCTGLEYASTQKERDDQAASVESETPKKRRKRNKRKPKTAQHAMQPEALHDEL